MSKAQLFRDGELGILRIDNPPVNALSPELVADLGDAFAAFEANDALVALVIECAGRAFVAGGDIAAFDDRNFSSAPFNAFLDRLEAFGGPCADREQEARRETCGGDDVRRRWHGRGAAVRRQSLRPNRHDGPCGSSEFPRERPGIDRSKREERQGHASADRALIPGNR